MTTKCTVKLYEIIGLFTAIKLAKIAGVTVDELWEMAIR